MVFMSKVYLQLMLKALEFSLDLEFYLRGAFIDMNSQFWNIKEVGGGVGGSEVEILIRNLRVNGGEGV